MTANVEAALQQVAEAKSTEKLTASAAQNLSAWLTEPRYSAYVGQLESLIAAGRWKELDDAFWTVIPFGTGGRRGKMFPVGCNVINDRTIGESAQGLADYVRAALGADAKLSCAIAYDTRHRSRDFAELCASIMAANGFTVYFHDGHRSTPQLSFAVRHFQCSCGIMITASHNPPSDNAVKVYWSTGGQLLPPHDRGVIDRVMQVDEIKTVPFAAAVASQQVIYCQAEVDAAFQAAVKAQSLPGPRDIKILYSPLHGVGGTAVTPVLKACGFTDVEEYGPHAEPNGDFPNVPGHVSNPENRAVFDAPIAYARQQGHQLILATDPDCDRLGCAAPATLDAAGPWQTFNGNQIGALLCEYLLAQRKTAKSLSPEHYVVKTLVTTEMIRRIADAFGAKTYGDLMVGFKYIGGVMDEVGPAKFVFGTEESHGYLVGEYARDKDGAVAALLLSELAAQVKSKGKSLGEHLDALYWQYGYHAEQQLNVTMPGSEGMSRMKALMANLRSNPPQSLAGLDVVRARDYQSLTELENGQSKPFAGPKGDMVILDLAEEGNYVAVRPSGTEPKVKFYMFAYVAAEQLALLDVTKAEIAEQFDRLERDLKAYAGV